MNISDLISTIHVSIDEANKDHSEWTGGWWLQAYGVEGFLVGRIADGIMSMENKPGFLTLETSFSELYDSCGRRPTGVRTNATKYTNRIDLALYNKQWGLTHVIEVKRVWSPECIKDLDRLCNLYKKYVDCSSLRDAIFVLLMCTSSKKNPSKITERLENLFSSIEERCELHVSKHALSCEFYRGTEYYPTQYLKDRTQAFSSLCVRIRK